MLQGDLKASRLHLDQDYAQEKWAISSRCADPAIESTKANEEKVSIGCDFDPNLLKIQRVCPCLHMTSVFSTY